MTGLTDFQTAMVVLFGIVLVFGLALAAQGRRAVQVPSKDGLDVIAADVAELKKRQVETDHNLAQIRTMMDALPSIRAFHQLELKVTAVDGKADVINTVALATSRAVERIERHLMKDEP